MIDLRQYLMPIMLVAIILLIGRSLLARSRDKKSKIDLDDLLIGEDGKLSKAAAVMMGAFAMTTWMMVFLTVAEKMTEGYLAIYGGLWVGPTVTALIVKGGVTKAQINADSPSPSPTLTAQTTTTTTAGP